ncbi:UxaA family hydrolase [Sedimentitalea sp. JM2-8]|uniref:UxaA family hydrolase n=1 Tax=Sedimentitalea xiamensis TaxID=3050037 RepID=A0ABT7FFT6_9RHOB|nr:UxaA family hydrolase [Sedimentitalea xiamensis]MDK3073905.1 UxaA family hydrolase [Sedimentitalea xiamensis]
MRNLIIVDAGDNVATTVVEIAEGTVLALDETTTSRPLTARQAIPFGHKIALVDLDLGDEVIKYGAVVGVATARILAGDHVHVHNIASKRIRGDIKQGDMA